MIILLFLLILLLTSLHFAQPSPSPSISTSPSKHKSVFAYGSLLNKWVLKAVFPHRPVTLYETTRLKGWKRQWLQYDDSVMLNITRETSSSEVNGILIPVTEDDLRRLDEYETTHDRIQISQDVYTYVAKTNFPHRPVILLKKMPDFYVQTVLDGFEQYGTAFVNEFFTTTSPT